MKQREQAALFLKKAAEDQTLVDAVLTDERVADATIGFHCQQAAEKLLKAWLSCLGLAFPRTHDLQELMNLLEAAGHRLPDELIRVDELTPFAVESRYDDLSFSERFDRSAAREVIHQLRAFVQKQMGLPST